MRRAFSAAFSVMILLSACGQKSGPAPAPTTSPEPSLSPDLSTGLEAVRIAQQEAGSATGVVRVTLSFPRPRGRAEFWTVFLVDPSTGAGFVRVEVQRKSVVRVEEAPEISEDPGAVPAARFDELQFDTSDAVEKVQALEWASEPGTDVVIHPVAFDVLDENAPEQVRGQPAWSLVVSRQQVIVGAVWISARSGEVLVERRAQ
ncbi:MAG: hypothetical protein KY429_08360 [Actinobacteria bacterium]|nr:hypothetical protein [Actinomycetota bacterium]